MTQCLLLLEGEQLRGRRESLWQGIVIVGLVFPTHRRGGGERDVAEGDGQQVAQAAVGGQQP